MEYVLYCILSACAIVISCTGVMTDTLKKEQYVCLTAGVFLILLLGWNRWGQWITFASVGGTVICAGILLQRDRTVNILIGLCTHLLNSMWNNGLLWLFAAVDPDLLAWALGDGCLVFSTVWILALLGLVRFYRYLVYSRWKLDRYLPISVRIQTGILTEIILFTVLFVINISAGQQAGYTKEVLMLNSVLLFGSLLINLVLFLHLGYVMRREEERHAHELSYQALENYTDRLERHYDQIRALRHDYRNILSSVAGYVRADDMKGLRSYLEKDMIPTLSSEMEADPVSAPLSRIGSSELKGFLYEKWLAASALGVEMHYEVPQNTSVRGIRTVDLIRLLGIYMDNAMEAAAAGKKKEVLLRILQEEDGVQIRIQNTCVSSGLRLDRLGEKGYSTKGEGHGMGLCSAGKILESCRNVFCETSLEDGLFLQTLYINGTEFLPL